MSQLPLLSPPHGIKHRKRIIWLNVKHYSNRIVHWEYFGLLLIIAVTLALHFAIINRPPTIVWDETYYVEDARNIINGAGDLRPEHPPLAKLFIVAGIHLFGDNSFGWRFFSIIFGTAGIAVFYLICRRLKLSRTASSIATFLFGLPTASFSSVCISSMG